MNIFLSPFHRDSTAQNTSPSISDYVTWMGRSIRQTYLKCVDFWCFIYCDYDISNPDEVDAADPEKELMNRLEVQLRPELNNPHVRAAVFKQLQASFSSCIEEPGEPKSFKKLISLLNQANKNPSIQIESQIFTTLLVLYSLLERDSDEYFKVKQYIEICFTGKDLALNPNEWREEDRSSLTTSTRLIKDFMTIVMNDKLKHESRFAALDLLQNLKRPSLQKKYQELEKRNSLFQAACQKLRSGPIPIAMKRPTSIKVGNPDPLVSINFNT